jgi:hypothetical protein
MWLDGKDAERVIALVPTAERPIVLEAFAGRTRPKRGLKLFLTAKATIYAGGTKARLHELERVEPVEFVGEREQRRYWQEGMPKDTTTVFWHGGGGGGGGGGLLASATM